MSYDSVLACTTQVVGSGNDVHEGLSTATFTGWARDAEPRLRRALTASFGSQVGRDATRMVLKRGEVVYSR